jgi:hypothetical protein
LQIALPDIPALVGPPGQIGVPSAHIVLPVIDVREASACWLLIFIG